MEVSACFEEETALAQTLHFPAFSALIEMFVVLSRHKIVLIYE